MIANPGSFDCSINFPFSVQREIFIEKIMEKIDTDVKVIRVKPVIIHEKKRQENLLVISTLDKEP